MKKFKVFALVFAIMLSATGLGLLFGSNQPASTQAKVSADGTTNATWYNDWTHSNPTASDTTISLTAYNGSETTYKVPATATIDGKVYSVIFGSGSSENSSKAQVNLGTITSLSFDEGVQFPTNSKNLFCGSKLTSLNLTGVDTTNVTNMSYMFSSRNELTGITFGAGFKTNNVTDMSHMFYNCSSLTNLDLSKFNTGDVTNMSDMFSGCSELTSLNLSSFNTSKVTNMSSMFLSCCSLTEITFPKDFGFPTAEGAINNMDSMFYNCSELTSLDLSNFNTSNVTAMNNMFQDCSLLTSLNLSSFNTSKVTSMYAMFYNCNSLTILDLNNFNTSNVINMYDMFNGCSSLTSLDLSTFVTSKVTNMGEMFAYCEALKNITFPQNFGLPTAEGSTSNMENMFQGCSSLTSLNLSNLNTSKVTNIGCMFNNCSELTSLDLSKFDTSKVTDMHSVFEGCSKLTKITFPQNFGFPTAEGATNNMDSMFECCTSLTSLDLSSFNTSKVTYMGGLFDSCSSLTSLDLSIFNTSNVTDMGYMFYGCASLQNIKMPNTMNESSTIKLSDLSLPSQNASSESISWYSLASGAKKGTAVVADNSVSTYAGNILTIDPNKSYDAINAEVFTPAKPETPSTGVVLDVVLPVASIVLVLASLVAVAFVGKKKKQY
jgi:surface protein